MGNFIFCAVLTKDFGDRLRLARNFLNLLSKYVFLKVSKTLISFLSQVGFTWVYLGLLNLGLQSWTKDCRQIHEVK